MDQTTIRFGFPDVSQNPLLGLNLSQVLGHWLSPERSNGCLILCVRNGTIATENTKGLLSENIFNLI